MKIHAAVAVLIAAGVVVAPAATAVAASGGYGPSAPTGPTGSPGGFDSIVTTKTFDSAGGRLTGRVAGGDVAVTVPPGAFGHPMQVEVTAPALAGVTSALPSVGFAGYAAVAGLGVKVLDANGRPLTGTFAKPVDVTISGPQLGVPGERVLRFGGASQASVVGSTVTRGHVVVHLTEDPNLAVVNPIETSGSAMGAGATVAGATTTHTGKPFAGEAALAAALVVTGAATIGVARWRAHHH